MDERVALVAAALENAIGAVELRGSRASLKEVIESNSTVDQLPEVFCCGRIGVCDFKPLAAMIAPRPVVLR